jgi:cytidine deaminase
MNMINMDSTADNQMLQNLVLAAQQAALHAYAPYSQFTVGCALLSKSGKIYTGCNIENASYSVTLCAERVAAAQAIAHRDREWDSLVVVSPQRVTTCGVCRQFLHEFAPDLTIWNGFLEGLSLEGPFSLHQLLPGAMTLRPINHPLSNS